MTFQMMDVFRSLFAANIAVKFESLPGAGKTATLTALAEASDGFLFTMTPVTHDATDFGGIPFPNVEELRYSMLAGEWVHRLNDEASKRDVVIYFADEANTASRTVMAALLKVFDEGIVGQVRLNAKIRRIMAVNPAEANGGVDLPPAMANRVAHVPFNVPVTRWADLLESGFPKSEMDALIIPDEDDLADALSDVRRGVAQYARTIGSVDRYPDDPVERSKAWMSRRSLTNAARGIAAARVLGFGTSTQSDVAASLIGRENADELFDVIGSTELINPDDILANVDAWTIPNRDDVLFTTLDAVTVRAIERADAASIRNAMLAFGKVANAGRPGVAVASVRTLGQFLRSNRNIITNDSTGDIVRVLRDFQPVLESAGGMDEAWTNGAQ